MDAFLSEVDAIFPVSEEGQRYRQVECAILTIKTQVGRGVHDKGCVCCAVTMGQLASCLNDPQTAGRQPELNFSGRF